SNYHLNDKMLSLKAKGLLSQILSLPPDWDYTLVGLSSKNRESVAAIGTAVAELEKAGYVTRKRTRDAAGKMNGIEYTIYEQPQVDYPIVDNPLLDKPEMDSPLMENRVQLNTNITKDSINKKTERPKGRENDFGLSAEARAMLNDYIGADTVLTKPMHELMLIRKEKGAKNTDLAIKLLLKKLDELSGGDVDTKRLLLEEAVLNSWKSVFPLKGGPREVAKAGGGLDEWT
ncbi:MAG: hypothetical protein RR949_01505, partial [Oscillospiraceae bacterium]